MNNIIIVWAYLIFIVELELLKVIEQKKKKNY